MKAESVSFDRTQVGKNGVIIVEEWPFAKPQNWLTLLCAIDTRGSEPLVTRSQTIFSFLFIATQARGTSVVERFVLGTGRLTIARAIGEKFFFILDKVWEDELRKFSEEKKKEYCRD